MKLFPFETGEGEGNYLTTEDLSRDIVTAIPRIEGGYAYAPEGIGLGTALQPDLLTRKDAHRRISKN